MARRETNVFIVLVLPCEDRGRATRRPRDPGVLRKRSRDELIQHDEVLAQRAAKVALYLGTEEGQHRLIDRPTPTCGTLPPFGTVVVEL
jgi:hypothetical protein